MAGVIVALASGDIMPDAHCTLAYLGDKTPDAVLEIVRAVASATDRFRAKVSGTANLGKDKVPVLLLESEPLIDLRKAFQGLDESKYPWWIPHLSVSYDKGGDHGKQADRTRIHFDAIGVLDNSSGVQERWVFPLRRNELGEMLAVLDARLALTAAFDPNQTRDAKGRWATAGGGKAWSGVSAHPDNRAKPIAKVFLDGQSDDEDFAKERGFNTMQEYINSVYTMDNLPKGHTARIDPEQSYTEQGTAYVAGTIHNQYGKEVGNFERSISYDHGELEAHHILLQLDPAAQGFGLADAFNTNAVAHYQDMGVDHISLEAGLDVGAYAWARQGFRLDAKTETERQVAFNEIAQAGEIKHMEDVSMREPTEDEQARFDALQAASWSGQDVQPIHLASIGEDRKYVNNDGITTWYGKDLLLGSGWNGVFYFDRNKPLTAAATDLEHASLRPAFRGETRQFTISHPVLSFATVDNRLITLYAEDQPRDPDGKFAKIFGSGNVDSVFNGAVTTGVPFERVHTSKSLKMGYPAARIADALRTGDFTLDEVDPRDLKATQPGIVRSHVGHYLGPEYAKTGQTAADQESALNKYPTVYKRKDGQMVIVSGHHRAVAALIKGEGLIARVITEQ